MTGRKWTLRITAPTGWLSKNERRHWAPKGADVAEWRKAGRVHAIKEKVRSLDGMDVTAVVRFPVGRKLKRRDAPNVYLAIAAVIDGLVDAGVVPDDNDSYVRALHILPGDPIPARPYGPAGELVLTIREVTDA